MPRGDFPPGFFFELISRADSSVHRRLFGGFASEGDAIDWLEASGVAGYLETAYLDKQI